MANRKKSMMALAFAVLAALTWYLSTVWTPREIQTALDGLGFWAPLVYIGLFTVLPAFFFPVAVLALAGGLVFGLWKGAALTFAGAMLNCTLMFFLARYAGRRQVAALLEKKLHPRWRQLLEGRGGFLFLVILRLIPAVPYNLINYAFGLTGMPWGTFILASAVGIIPGTLAFINIGDKALDVTSADFWIAIGLLAGLLAVTTWLGKILYKEKEK